MKQYVLTFFVVVLFAACNNTPDAATAVATEPTRNNEKAVSLNRDSKWQADASTTKNVSLLQQKAAELNKGEKKTAGDYHYISDELQTGITQLVKECKMKGPDHDALHLWLEPLMEDVKALKTVTTLDTGDRLFYSIRTRLLDYNLYFQ